MDVSNGPEFSLLQEKRKANKIIKRDPGKNMFVVLIAG
jgi:hypothetical protein